METVTTVTEVEDDLFGTVQVKKKPAKGEKVRAVIDAGDIPLARRNQLKAEIEDREAEYKMIDGEARELVRREFPKMCQLQQKRPESFILKSKDGGSNLVLIIDKYTTQLSEEKIKSSPIGEQVIVREEAFTFNADYFKTYRAAISRAIKASTEIPEEIKPLLIFRQDKISIRKGIIDTLHTFGEKVKEVFDFCEPQIQLKKNPQAEAVENK